MLNSSAELYRLFIAIELPSPVKSALAGVQNQLKTLKAVRWTKPEQIHLTLQFLADTPADQVSLITAALSQTVSQCLPFKVSLSSVGVFPNFKHPRVVWAGIADPWIPLAALQQAVLQATGPLGFKPEDRPFKPHLTIGRVQEWATSSDYTQIEQSMQQTGIGQIAAFHVKQIALIRSRLQRGGPVYTTLAEIKLLNRENLTGFLNL